MPCVSPRRIFQTFSLVFFSSEGNVPLDHGDLPSNHNMLGSVPALATSHNPLHLLPSLYEQGAGRNCPAEQDRDWVSSIMEGAPTCREMPPISLVKTSSTKVAEALTTTTTS